MRDASCVEVCAPPAERLAYLLRDYADLGADPETLAGRMVHFKEALGRETMQRWQAWARDRQLSALFAELMALHYDPHYARSQQKHFRQWAARRRVEAQSLEDAALPALARQVADAARELHAS